VIQIDFSETDFRKVLKRALLELKVASGQRYTFQKMADACRVQKTYLSRVLGGNGTLNADQIYAACQYLKLDADQSEYLQLLNEKERSVFPERKQQLESALTAIRARKLRSESALDATVIDSTKESHLQYYLEPYSQVVHLFLTIPRYQRKPERIAESLDLEPARLWSIVEQLVRGGFVVLEAGKYCAVPTDLHLSAESVIYPAWRTLQRTLTLQKIQRASIGAQDYHFTVLFSTDPDARTRIQARFLEFLREMQEIVRNAPETNVYQANFDLFAWGGDGGDSKDE
jgi:transcriptional regulator with XRE-family HTH domain